MASRSRTLSWAGCEAGHWSTNPPQTSSPVVIGAAASEKRYGTTSDRRG